MTTWEIVRIDEDPGPTPDEDRWLVSYRVPLDYSPDGTFSYSFPKNSMNKWATLYEYDVTDPGQTDELFDYVMSRPQLKARPLAAPPVSGHPLRVTPEEATRVAALSDDVNAARLAAHPVHALTSPAGELRAAIKKGVGAMKRGEAPLIAAPSVGLSIDGMPAIADGSENPKYILKRDLEARLDPGLMAVHRAHFERERASLMVLRAGGVR
jgi:hypothetical protein